MRTRGMVDRVLAAARGAAFKTLQLPQQSLVVEQLHALARHERQERAVDVRLRMLADEVSDASLLEALLRPGTRIRVPGYVRDAVVPQHERELLDRCLWRER